MAFIEILSTVLYDSLDNFKSKSVFSALPAFMVHMGMLTASMTKKRVVKNIENRRRLRLAFANYGLN